MEKRIAGFGQFFATWLNNIASQGYEPVRATMLVNDEEVDVELRPAPEAVPPRGAASRAASAVARSSYLLSSRTIGYAFSSTQFLNSSPRFS